MPDVLDVSDYVLVHEPTRVPLAGLAVCGDKLYRDAIVIGTVLWVTRIDSGWRITYVPQPTQR